MKVKDSQRLSYSMIDVSDAEFLFQLDQDPEVMKYINGGKPNSMQEIKQVLLPRLMSYASKDKGWGLWKVSLKDDGEAIGWILVRPMNFFSDSPELDNLELGWRFFQKEWGKGFATEAARQLMNAIHQQRSIRMFSAIAMPSNSASINIMTKLGMEYQKTAIHKDPLGEDEVVYYGLPEGFFG